MPMLEVPYVSQWGGTANLFIRDCGVACVKMVGAYYGKMLDKTIDQLSRQTPLTGGDAGLVPAALVVLASKYELPLKVINLDEDGIRAQINKGQPVIVLIAYRFITERMDQADNKPGSDGHFFVIVGYDDTHFVCNDPDFFGTQTLHGKQLPVFVTHVMQAMSIYRYQAIVIDEDAMANLDEIKALATQLKANAAQQSSLADEIITKATESVPQPPVPPQELDYVVTGPQGANVRRLPKIDPTNIKATLLTGTAIKVILNVAIADGLSWAKLTAPADLAGYFVAQSVIGPKV